MLTLEEVADFKETDQNEPTITAIKALEDIKQKPTAEKWEDYWRSYTAPQEPNYLRRGKYFRWKGRFVEAPVNTEAKFAAELNRRLFRKYMAGADAIAEFGCGSGKNLIQMRDEIPSARRYAYDRSHSAVELSKGIASGRQFDMVAPTPTPELRGHKDLVVFTSGAMEQLGFDYRAFLHYMLELNARTYVHVEPIVEFYDNTKSFDYLAKQYHIGRDYLAMFLTALRSTVGVKIERMERVGFGNQYNEGYSTVVWHTR